MLPPPPAGKARCVVLNACVVSSSVQLRNSEADVDRLQGLVERLREARSQKQDMVEALSVSTSYDPVFFSPQPLKRCCYLDGRSWSFLPLQTEVAQLRAEQKRILASPTRAHAADDGSNTVADEEDRCVSKLGWLRCAQQQLMFVGLTLCFCCCLAALSFCGEAVKLRNCCRHR